MSINISKDIAKKSVGFGWANLIESIYDKLPKDAYIAQIKEKFGGLRFYVYGVDEDTLDFISDIERKSLSICEVCGGAGIPRDTVWIKTLCDKHFNVYINDGNLFGLDFYNGN